MYTFALDSDVDFLGVSLTPATGHHVLSGEIQTSDVLLSLLTTAQCNIC
jgi:hypothetical protein